MFLEETGVEIVEGEKLPEWDAMERVASRRFGDRWLEEGPTAVLSVPSVAARPFGRNLLINPAHPAFPGISAEPAVDVVRDPRLFRR